MRFAVTADAHHRRKNIAPFCESTRETWLPAEDRPGNRRVGGVGMGTVFAAGRAEVRSGYDQAMQREHPRGVAVGGGRSPGRVTLNCQPLSNLIGQAYVLFANGRMNPRGRHTPIEGGPPAWMSSDLYTIEAKAEGTPSQGTMYGRCCRRFSKTDSG